MPSSDSTLPPDPASVPPRLPVDDPDETPAARGTARTRLPVDDPDEPPAQENNELTLPSRYRPRPAPHRGAPEPWLELIGNRLVIDYEAAEKAFGSKDKAFIEGIARELTGLQRSSGTDEQSDLSFYGSVVAGIAPRDPIEALLAVQMAGMHSSMMLMTNRLQKAENTFDQDSAERALNKLARTFMQQMDTLQRHRGGGQTVHVAQVTVNEGGQAVVGNLAGPKPTEPRGSGGEQ